MNRLYEHPSLHRLPRRHLRLTPTLAFTLAWLCWVTDTALSSAAAAGLAYSLLLPVCNSAKETQLAK
ncbi:hypothetical protein E2C01_091282 [Portunus trituberculatus]|uniref:Uncharacterized protein n=1 Tax=Portunus trituberculatus TaxID=210409 RepID=A0A5B7JNY9_PORTR|nr:hypothetical protein [Portunus trituberculatus]